MLGDHSERAVTAAAERLSGEGYDVTTRVTDVSEQEAVEALADAAAALGPVTQVVHTAGVSPTQATVERILHVDLLGTAFVLDAFAHAIAPGGAGIVIASMAGQRESPHTHEIEHALATTETSQLLTLPFLQPERIGSTVHAYALSKRTNSLRVQTAAVAWGRRAARVNAVSPGAIIAPLARDELSGPRGEWFEQVRKVSPAGRFGTPERGRRRRRLPARPAKPRFVTGADLLMDGGVTAALRAGELTTP
ncbi:SDR family oxidoreductase [Streptomyces sp. Go40/10]|nr:SDR family oxidoreductase [Streptomyces sp. Go40/10]